MSRRSLKGARTQGTRTEGLFRATMPWLAEDYVQRFAHTKIHHCHASTLIQEEESSKCGLFSALFLKNKRAHKERMHSGVGGSFIYPANRTNRFAEA